MDIFTVLLCALVSQVVTQTNAQADDLHPARILAQQKIFSESSDMYVTCSTFGNKKNAKVYVYLCKNDHAIIKKTQKRNQNDTTFTIFNVSPNHSGNYSCVYSTTNHSVASVAKKGLNIIQMLVIASFLPADVSVAGPSTVSEGDDVELRCSVSDTLQTLGGCQLIHSYLMRNESIIRVGAFNVTQMEAAFTIRGAVMRDLGHYSCMVLPTRCIRANERRLRGNNVVLLEVKENSSYHIIVYCGLITLVLLLYAGLCLCCIKKPAVSSAACCSCAESQSVNTVVMEEQQEQQERQELTEGEDLAAQDEDSFITDEEGECGNVDSDPEGVYSLADERESYYDDIDQICAKENAKDDPPASRQYVYATSIKKKRKAGPVLA